MPQAMNSPVLRNDHNRTEDIQSITPRRVYRPLQAPGAFRVVVRPPATHPVPANAPKEINSVETAFAETPDLLNVTDRPGLKLASRLISACGFIAWIFLMLSMATSGNLLQLGAITMIPFLAHVISLYLSSLGNRDFSGATIVAENS